MLTRTERIAATLDHLIMLSDERGERELRLAQHPHASIAARNVLGDRESTLDVIYLCQTFAPRLDGSGVASAKLERCASAESARARAAHLYRMNIFARVDAFTLSLDRSSGEYHDPKYLVRYADPAMA